MSVAKAKEKSLGKVILGLHKKLRYYEMELVEMRLQNAGETPLLFAGLQPGGFTSPSLTPQDRQNIANED